MTGGVWIASYVLLWVAVLVLAAVVVALLRQVGVLHARLRPLGVHFGGEGPEPGSSAPPVPDIDWSAAPLTLVAFTAPDCEICKQVLPSLRALDREYADVRVTVVDHGSDTLGIFRAFRVVSTPYVVTVGSDGVVRGRGVANSLEQVEELVQDSRKETATGGQ